MYRQKSKNRSFSKNLPNLKLGETFNYVPTAAGSAT